MISLAVDFDGTLVEDKFPEIGTAKPEVVELIKELQELGVHTVLWTCRKGDMLPPAVEWCKQHGLSFDSVNENLPEVKEKWGGDTRKVMVDYYFDDKNLGGIEAQIQTLLCIKQTIKKNKG